MKYSKSNPPMKCMMTQSTCYKGTKKMTVKGVLWHSTGANNPTLKRYVQPDDGAPTEPSSCPSWAPTRTRTTGTTSTHKRA